MKKSDLLSRLNMTTRKLGDVLGISGSAVAQWDDVPELRMLQLEKLYPELAEPSESAKAAA